MHRHRLKKFQLALIFASAVFLIMLLTMFICFIGMVILSHLGYLKNASPLITPIFIFVLFCLLVGVILAFIVSHRPLSPLQEMIEGFDAVSKGDYSVRLTLKGPEQMRELSSKFNHMAQELSSVELLRTDFINNFSHEFKTPIVSIRGFAKMLQRDDLTEQERKDYLQIIISESERLSDLSVNVLRLSKLEQQTELQDCTTFNISEQMRQVVALLDEKLNQKNLQIDIDCSEVSIYGNQELLKQVWINLFDNAIKFSPTNQTITVRMVPQDTKYRFIITNHCDPLPTEESMSHLFDKFYQADRSHTEKGNGLGLTIAQRIIELHSGTINACIGSDQTVSIIFELPKTNLQH